ncbi:hypothetical protein BAUCODRAFT_31892 [Baudoinia panamericana UAMH 10762]|uniref:Uncharacterized protein n=1 Tax=Baudoinia panamericana (strain UAMH 10762) TaxID=717646 RepID=M2LTL9_BAUPA|nr:uncharacterized protein BAUCODRAFT_31892 [Baudoinia panamericana UAMH 10762]EMC97882.1 hypothetical protein BAUCODRAFT_31892 [Baudoinia panamericana UAMH 10762]
MSQSHPLPAARHAHFPPERITPRHRPNPTNAGSWYVCRKAGTTWKDTDAGQRQPVLLNSRQQSRFRPKRGSDAQIPELLWHAATNFKPTVDKLRHV